MGWQDKVAKKVWGKAMKGAMKKAGVEKPTFPGPRATELLNKELKKSKAKGADKVETALKMRKDMKTGAQKPGASAIEIDARINRKSYRDFGKIIDKKDKGPTSVKTDKKGVKTYRYE